MLSASDRVRLLSHEVTLTGSPATLASLHAQDGRLLGPEADLAARLRRLRGRYAVVIKPTVEPSRVLLLCTTRTPSVMVYPETGEIRVRPPEKLVREAEADAVDEEGDQP